VVRQAQTATDPRIGSVEAALAIVGDRWSLLILREVFQGVRRFDDFLRNTGVSRAVLSSRLRTLTAAGLLRREPYRDGSARSRAEYRPTRVGVKLLPALVALMEWAGANVDGAAPADVLTHRGCGGRVHANLACDAGHEVSPDEIDARRAGPP
jgi:DNA-binding HxlR family transcriptional regulator